MTLAPGTRLGSYEIVALIGAGGMGEVYRARDGRLGRDVAVKILPGRLANDPVALGRFEREARAVAALSHPNILAVHDTGEADGHRFVAMELLEGQTLRQLLDVGPLSPRRVVEYGGQIANGLAAAHARGVIHRDLKPENLFVTGDGHVKILDFGLARQAFAPAAGDEATAAMTEPGVVMGTVGYMSPEQVQGSSVDHRSDIFSLGVVLYEMLTRRRPFDRATAAETMTAVLREDPPPLELKGEGLSSGLERVVDHCLEKTPSERFQSARDLSFSLRSSLVGSGTERAIVKEGGGGKRSRAPMAALALVVLVLAAAMFLWGRHSAVTGDAVIRREAGQQPIAFTQVTDQPGVETAPSISPDGKSVAYVKTEGADSAIYLIRVGNRNPVRLTARKPGDDHEPAFSPDGERIAFRSGNAGIFLMTASGESVTRLTDAGYFPGWSPNGSEIVYSSIPFVDPTFISTRTPGLLVVNVQTGHIRPLAVAESALQPAWSPHGNRVAYWAVHGNFGQRDLWTAPASGAAVSVAVTNDSAVDWSPTWSPDGRFLYFSSNRGGTVNLWRVPIDEASGKPLGDAEPVAAPTAWAGFISFSRDGSRLVFASLDYKSTLLRAPFDPERGIVTGPPVAALRGNRPIRDHDLSPDGQWVAFTSAGAQEDVFVARVDGTEYRRLTDDASRDRGVAWSPDGSRLGLVSDRSGTYDLWTVRPDGSELAPLTQGTGQPGVPAWAPAGSRIAFGFSQWSIVNTSGPIVTRLDVQPPITPTEQFQPTSWSRDGQRIAGVVVTGPVAAAAVYTIATRHFDRVPGEMSRGSTWVFPMWLADGRRLLIRRSDGVALVDAQSGTGRLLIPVAGGFIGRNLGVSRDNRWITYTETATEGDIWVATMSRPSQP